MQNFSPVSPKACLPKGFPQSVLTPRFKIGDYVQWQTLPTRDFGIIIGLQYTPITQLQQWNWQYVIWLDSQSPSYRWIQSDMAWETSLEPIPSTDNQP